MNATTAGARRVGVVGGGTMGIGIVHALVTNRIEAVLCESDAATRAAFPAVLSEVLRRGVERGVLGEEEAELAARRLLVVAAIEHIPEELDLAIEAVPERLELKVEVLRALEDRRPGLLASNTSSISIAALAAQLREPGAFLGLHFFNPVWSMRLVEVVIGPRTSPQALAAAEAFVAVLGKEAVVVRDAPGFATSRLGVLLGLEAVRMLEQGVASAEDIDRAMVLGYGHPVGPLRLTDLVGLDVRLDIARNLAAAYGERFSPPALLEEMVRAGKLGKKTGEGFFAWDERA